MRAAIIIASLFLSNTALADRGGLLCDLKFNGTPAVVHFSVDPQAGRYTARLGDSVVRRNEEVVFEYGTAFKFLWKESPTAFWLRVVFDGGVATTMGLSGSFATRVGTCKDDGFKGL